MTEGKEADETWQQLKKHLNKEQFDKADEMLKALKREELIKIARIKDGNGDYLLSCALENNAPPSVIYPLISVRAAKTVANNNLDLITQERMDNFLARPLLELILYPKKENSNWGSSADTGPGSVPLRYYPMLAESVCRSQELQGTVNYNSTERHAVFVMMADFYANCALIGLFLDASDAYVTNASSPRSIVGLHIVVGYLLMRQYLTIRAQKLQYLQDFWNFHDLCRLFLVLIAAISMKHNNRVVVNEVESLLLWAGALVFTGMVSFLRNTFLPFSMFVSGVLSIFRVLLPFFIVSGLVLLAFSYLYFVSGYEEDCICVGGGTCTCEDFKTLKDAFLKVYAYFAAGPDDSAGILDIVFFVVVVIIFLNVVIAIVNKAWEDTAKVGAHSFWLYRIGFLAELWPLEMFTLEHRNSRIGGLLRWVDSLEDRKLFRERMCDKFAPKDEKPRRNSGKGSSERELPEMKPLYTFVFVTSIVLGIPTCGLLWPPQIRKMIFGRSKTTAVSDSGETEKLKAEIQHIRSNVKDSSESDLLQDEIKILKSGVQDDMKNLKNDVHGELSDLESSLQDDIKDLKSDMQHQINKLKSDVRNLKSDIQTEIKELKSDVQNLYGDIHNEIDKLKSDMQNQMNEIQDVMLREIRSMQLQQRHEIEK